MGNKIRNSVSADYIFYATFSVKSLDSLSGTGIVLTMLFENQILVLSGAINTDRYTPQKEREKLCY